MPRIPIPSTVWTECASNSSFLGQPTEVGFLSYDSQGRIHFDRRQMKYYVPPRNNEDLNLDLNYGSESWRPTERDEAPEKMERVLRWIVKDDFSAVVPETGVSVDFVTGPGTLKNIMQSAFYFHPTDSWCICASKVNNTIYFCHEETEAQVSRRNVINTSQDERKKSWWGTMFEKYMTSDTSGGEPNLQSLNFGVESFSVVLKNNFNDHTLLYSAEIDAIKSGSEPGCPSNYVEFKTSIEPSLRRHFGRNVAFRWWMQSRLAGIEDIVCGLRDDRGRVRSIRTFTTSALADKYANETGNPNTWDPNTCIKFCSSFLTILKNIVREDDPRVVYKFDYSGGPVEEGITCEDLDVSENPRFQVIPEWYASALAQKLRG